MPGSKPSRKKGDGPWVFPGNFSGYSQGQIIFITPKCIRNTGIKRSFKNQIIHSETKTSKIDYSCFPHHFAMSHV